MLGTSACGSMDIPTPADKQQTKQLEKLQNDFITRQPIPEVEFSVERQNVIDRIKRWNDPNKVSYIYLISENGIILAYFPIKGKVTALNTYATPDLQIVDDPYARSYEGSQGQVVDAPDELGTYGENNDGVFFFLTDGTYVEWTGHYLLADQPIKLTQQPIMLYEIESEK